MDGYLFAFVGIVAALTVTPGATTMLIARSVIARGQRAGFRIILGGSAGVYVHATLSALGLSLILVQSAQLFQAIKLFGAAYLIYLGVQSVRRGWRDRSSTDHRAGAIHELPLQPGCCTPSHDKHGAGGNSFNEGLITILLSPETSLFYLTILPPFIDPGDSVLVHSLSLATIHVLVRVAWYSLLTLFVGRMVTALRRPRVRQRLELASGIALIGLGIKVATARR
jgi:threonine/homoserine/homoserine lactone efflux protein